MQEPWRNRIEKNKTVSRRINFQTAAAREGKRSKPASLARLVEKGNRDKIRSEMHFDDLISNSQYKHAESGKMIILSPQLFTNFD